MDLKEIFDKLWRDYTHVNPSAGKIHDLFTREGEEVINDHIAFRTFDDPRVNINVLAKPFTSRGYVPKGEYDFTTKHLFARHYELPDQKDAPRVFISQLISSDFPDEVGKIIKETLNSVPEDLLEGEELLFSGGLLDKPEYAVYEFLRKHSEYAAWMYVFGFRANHFTVSVNHLKKYDSLEKVNILLKENGFLLNSSGGEIKGTPQQLLRQSSTLADKIDIEFKEGTYRIPACYYEFAQRYPNSKGELYSGFIAKSADKIFESTNYRK